MTKREILIAICETPGYAPADSSSHGTAIAELKRDGWIIERRANPREYAATSKALDAYPDFSESQELSGPREAGPTAEPPPETVGLDALAVWCASCLSMVTLEGDVVPSALRCTNCKRVIAHSDFWR